MTAELEQRLRADLPRLADALLAAPSPEKAERASIDVVTTGNGWSPRRLVLVAAIVIAVVAGVAVPLALREDDDGGRLNVHDSEPSSSNAEATTTPSTGLPPTSAVPAGPSPLAVTEAPARLEPRIELSPAGPYRAGDEVTITMPTEVAGDYYNDFLRLCFAWGSGETCDPSAFPQDADPVAAPPAGSVPPEAETVSWTRLLPGWVTTPDGLRPCNEVGCRIVGPLDGDRVGTAALDIEPGPQPEPPVRINEIGADGSIVVEFLGVAPDQSWIDWAAGDETRAVDLPPVWMNLCVYTATGRGCDPFMSTLPQPPIDGSAFSLTLEPRRLLLRPFVADGWTDCVEFTCALVVWRATDVEGSDGGVASGSEIAALVPYRLPSTTAEVPLPSVTLDPAGPYTAGQSVAVTVRDVPRWIDPGELSFSQCAGDDPTAEGCLVPGAPTTLHYAGDDTLLTGQHVVKPCSGGPTCYLVVTPPWKGYSNVARTERFTVG